jgi:hypothetical protein
VTTQLRVHWVVRVLSLGQSGWGVKIPSSAEVENEWSYARIPHIRLRDFYRNNFAFYLLPKCIIMQPSLGQYSLLLLLLPLALQPAVGFGLSNNILPFFSICRQLSPSPHS